ncbi:MAG TPA: hypothetical protein VJ715_09985 [Pyrinomonadaceae bacterium]|nr:hypothetical protein [Pyrinomonadaceae bacterium]
MKSANHEITRKQTKQSLVAFICFRVNSWFVRSSAKTKRRRGSTALAVLLFVIALPFAAWAHPLGNFSINHFARLEVGDGQVRVRYVVDMAEIPAFQEMQALGEGMSGPPSTAALDAYVRRAAAQYADGLVLLIDEVRVPLKSIAQAVQTPQGAGGLQTLRVECDYAGEFSAATGGAGRRLRFENTNHRDRAGWREIVVVALPGVSIFDSSAYANGLTDELRAYPEDRLLAPLDERAARLSFTRGLAPAGSIPLRTREGRPFRQARDRFSELIVVPELTPMVALLGLLVAAALGAVHALSPGHGKAVVGAYLIGSRGTPRHAVFLGLTVTVTHTSSVFALGLVTLFASQYVMPERLFPVLGFISGAIVLVVGLGLFIRRLRVALVPAAHAPTHHHAHHAHDHQHEHEHEHEHSHHHEHHHTHGHAHTHLPPGADGERVTWRSLLALGISGGLLPCPSALVVMLSAIALHRVGYGLVLVVAFSFGLACTLTCVGLAFVYAGRLMKGRVQRAGRFLRWLPPASALVIACLGAAICYQALVEAGLNPLAFLGV